MKKIRAVKKLSGILLAGILLMSNLFAVQAQENDVPDSEPKQIRADEWVDVSALGSDIIFDEGWTKSEREGMACSYTKGSKAELTFYGTGIRWIGQKDINFGYALVKLDGELAGEVNTNGPAQKGITHFEKTGLEPGVHTISIEPKEAGVFDVSGCIDIEKYSVQYDTSAVIPASSIELTASASEIFAGETLKLTSSVAPFNASKDNVVYSSENEEIASVDKEGTVTGHKKGSVKITAAVPGTDVTAAVEITVKEFTVGEMRMQIDNEHPLFLHHLYRQLFPGLPGPLQGGKDIQGFWDSLKNKDVNGKGIDADLLENQAIIIHASGELKGDAPTLAWYEETFKKTVKDQIPFFVMISNSGTSTSNGGVYFPPATEWVSRMYDEYPNMMGVIFSENHNATSQAERQARSEYMREQVLLAAEKGGHVIYSDMNDQNDYVESVLDNQELFDTLKQYKDNFVLLAKTTSAWSNVSYNSHESVAQGAWMSDIAGNWGSLIDSWMWFIEGFGPLYGDETFSVMGGVEECRGPVSFPELLFEMRMEQQARVGATVFSFEHPDYTTSVAKDNGNTNLFTPAFTESIVKAMEYMKEYDIPTKEEVLKETKVAYSAENGTLNSLASSVNLLNPLYGDKNYNGYNNGTMMVYSTGRYGTIPSLPRLATAEDKAQFDYVLTKDSVINELKDEQGIKEFFDNIYPENYSGDGYAHFTNNTWLTYNTNWNIDSRAEDELFSSQSVEVGLKNNEIKADITFNPYTLIFVDDQKNGELKFRFNNYLVDKNEIWKDYVVSGPGETPHWNSDADTGMYDYLTEKYIPDAETEDDIYRHAVIKLQGLEKEPKLEMVKELVNTDGSKQCEAPKTSWNEENGEYTIELSGNGWQEFKLTGFEPEVIPGADYSAVDAAIAEADTLNPEDYMDFSGVTAAVNAVERGWDITEQERVDAMAQAIRNAIESLKLKADKTELKELLDEYAALELNKYTEESAAEFKAALEMAKKVMEDDTLSEDDQKTVDDAVKALRNAKKNLVERTDTDGSDTEKPDDNDRKDDADKTATTPKTGDTTNTVMLFVVAGAALAACIAVRRKGK